MARFRKKPVEIEAVRYDGSNVSEVREFCPKALVSMKDTQNLLLPTLEGQMVASPGDWIICGVAGEFYPCKPDIFEQTYEPVDTSWDGVKSKDLPPADAE